MAQKSGNEPIGNKKSRNIKLNNRGSAMIFVMTILSLISILGVLAMSTALINVRMRGINRDSDKNFYYLETALDEIYARTGMMSSEILKSQYESILKKLYIEGADGFFQGEGTSGTDPVKNVNENANAALKLGFMEQIFEEFALTLNYEESGEMAITDEQILLDVSTILRGYSPTLGKKDLEVRLDSILVTKQTGSAAAPNDNFILKGLCLTYTDPESQIESALTVDLKINVPYVRFVNEGDAILDYVMVANKGIEINKSGTARQTDTFTGNIYGSQISIERADVKAKSGLIASKGTISVKNEGNLSVSPAIEGGKSHLWANGLELLYTSKLESDAVSMYVQDDMTLQGDNNAVKLSGDYYGYGNEGGNGLRKAAPDKSSAILLNDKSSVVDLTGLNSLMLAGRAYLRFNTAGSTSQYVYPMGESLAVRATQVMYLIPEECITIVGADGVSIKAGSNPVAFPEGADRITLKISVPSTQTGGPREGIFEVTREQVQGEGAAALGQENSENMAAFLVALNGKIYVYFNFASDAERSEYFEKFLEEQAGSFDALLKKGEVTGEQTGSEGESGIWINGGKAETGAGRVVTSGALYQVAGNGGAEGEHLFELLQTGTDGVSDSLKWVDYGRMLSASFENIQNNLAETMKVSGRIKSDSIGADALLPAGNYVRLNELKKLDWLYRTKEVDGNQCEVFLTGRDVEIIGKPGGGVTVKAPGGNQSMQGGLIVSYGDVTVDVKNGDVNFDGLIIAGGTIRIKGNEEKGTVNLTAAAQNYLSLLEEEEIAKYFYDYSDAASTVLNDYEDFVVKENWSRTGRERGGDADEEN